MYWPHTITRSGGVGILMGMLRPISDLARAYWRGGRPLDSGKVVYEALEPGQRPGWAGSLLRFAIGAVVAPLGEIAAAIPLATDPTRWHEGYTLFERIRQHTVRAEATLSAGDPQLALLHLAENTAKVAYNASGGPRPFDHDAGWWLVANLFDIAATAPDRSFSERALDLVVSPLEQLS
jgi:hypothetical protein